MEELLMNIIQFKNHLISDEKSEATVSSYVRDVTTFISWLNGREMSKELIMATEHIPQRQQTRPMPS